MKLARVVFRHVVTLPSGQRVSEVTAAGFPDAQFDFDSVTACVRLGSKRIPIASVVEFDVAEDEARCPDCSQTFANQSAVGAHRSYVHEVPGKRRAKEKEKTDG